MEAETRQLRDWLFQRALPLWATTGRDQAGFVEKISFDGEAHTEIKRCRVQTRQIYCFSAAGQMGWDGDWAMLVRHGLSFLLDHYALPGGGYCFSVQRSGAIADHTIGNYDLAFVIFALAHAADVVTEVPCEQRALAVLDYLENRRAHPDAGFFEDERRQAPLLTNPHMHLFEAALVWRAVPGSSPRWGKLADMLGNLALTRLIDTRTDTLCEQFDDAWRPMSVKADPSVEPGHQFEWASLLQLWAPDKPAMRAAAASLYAFAARFGIDRHHGVVVNEVTPHGAQVDANARLWPQTEWLRAALVMAVAAPAALRAGYEKDARDAFAALWRFLDTPHAGLWYDRLQDGVMREGASPATSLYHIVSSASELFAYDRAVSSA